MKILSKRIVNKYKNKILNIHPSLLPRYKGLNTHKRVIMNKESFTGCTVHIVNSKLDAGKTILLFGFYNNQITLLKREFKNKINFLTEKNYIIKNLERLTLL